MSWSQNLHGSSILCGKNSEQTPPERQKWTQEKVILPLCHSAILPFCHFIILPSGHSAVLSYRLTLAGNLVIQQHRNRNLCRWEMRFISVSLTLSIVKVFLLAPCRWLFVEEWGEGCQRHFSCGVQVGDARKDLREAFCVNFEFAPVHHLCWCALTPCISKMRYSANIWGDFNLFLMLSRVGSNMSHAQNHVLNTERARTIAKIWMSQISHPHEWVIWSNDNPRP